MEHFIFFLYSIILFQRNHFFLLFIFFSFFLNFFLFPFGKNYYNSLFLLFSNSFSFVPRLVFLGNAMYICVYGQCNNRSASLVLIVLCKFPRCPHNLFINRRYVALLLFKPQRATTSPFSIYTPRQTTCNERVMSLQYRITLHDTLICLLSSSLLPNKVLKENLL